MLFNILCITIITTMLPNIFIASFISFSKRFVIFFIIVLFSIFPDIADLNISFIFKSEYIF